MKNIVSCASLLLVAALSFSDANATPTPYPNVGTQNAVLYSFTANHSGDILAYFAGSTASYDNTVSLLVNGVDTGISGLDDHTSAYGDVLDFGPVNAGDSLVFRLNVLTTGDQWFSNVALNADHGNHVYSNAYGGDALIPAGTYVAFEDQNFLTGSDLNYHDENFVFTNVDVVNNVPLPGTVFLFGLGLAMMGIFMARNKVS